MQITSALVLLAVIWFTVLFVVLPMNIRTQGETGDVVPGTPRSAPSDPQLKRKAKLITLISVPIWIVACAIIATGTITVDDFDLYKRFGPASGAADGAGN
jgi:predicted secreted protein